MIVGHSISNVVEKIEKTIYPRHIHQFSLLLGFASSLIPCFWVKGHSFLAESGYPSPRRRTGDLAINAWRSMPLLVYPLVNSLRH